MAMMHLQAGRLSEADAIFRRVLAVAPDNVDALHLIGVIAHQLGQHEQAITFIKQAIARNPAACAAHNNLGSVFQVLGKLEEAASCYRDALRLKPDFAEAHFNLGVVLEGQGRPEQALACYQQALAYKPGYFKAHNNLGLVLQGLGRLDEAVNCYRRALALKPDFAEAHYNLGLAFQARWEFAEARASYRQALAYKPDYSRAHNNLGIVLQELGDLGEAMNSYRRALAVNAGNAEGYSNLGDALQKQGEMDEAVACFRRALELNPALPIARINLLHQLQQRCEWDALDANVQLLRQAVREAPAPDNNRVLPFGFLALPGTTASEQKRCAEKWVQAEFQQGISLGKKLGFAFKREPGQKIHVGYLSADFHDHATMRLMAEVFELHDRSRFHITAYSSGPDNGSAMRARAKNAFDKFVDIRDDSLEGAARKIHADRIDILVDLKGYTQHSRSAILALRPAPVQVNYLGYPGTMGADFVDYLIADRFIIPPEHFEHYSEKVVWLPDCYQPNDRTRPRLAAPSRESCGLPDAGMVFCCFNQTYKITPEIFDVWCRLLQAVPGSVLWLLAKPHVEDNLRREAERRGVDPERLVMAPGLAPEKHLARLQCADLFLDTIPYNAHTTCSDALWMGLPVITCVGETFPSRVAGSLLTAMGMPELITYNLEDYYALALSLALDREKREGMRNKIIALQDTAPLFDSVRFTRNLEAVYAGMWEEYGG